MKCPEVVEWMHRYMDYDLSEEETVEMYEHLKNCPECADTFRILKSLSRDLEDLPKVTPKFSLVDAIMPQLDAIDQAREEKSASREEVPAEMTPVPHRNGRKGSFFNSVAGRTVMGSAAAAVILGIAIFTYQPKELSNAEEKLGTKPEVMQNQKSDTATQDEIQPYESSDDASNPESEHSDRQDVAGQEQGQEVSNEGRQGTEEAPDKSEPPAKDDSAEPNTLKTSTQEKTGEQAVEQSDATAAENKQSKSNDSSTPGNDADGNAAAEETSKAQETSVPDSDHPTQGIAGSENNDKFKADSIGDSADSHGQGLVATPPIKQDNQSSKEQITAKSASRSWKSPDGKYTVSVEENKLVIYSDDTGQKSVMNTIDLQGSKVVNGIWSADSTVFTYQAEDANGAVTSKAYSVENNNK